MEVLASVRGTEGWEGAGPMNRKEGISGWATCTRPCFCGDQLGWSGGGGAGQ